MNNRMRNQTLRQCATRRRNGQHQAYKTWNAMRMLRHFTVGELTAVVATSTQHSVANYASALSSAGFLRMRRTADGPALYQLVRNTGPVAPSIVDRRRAVYDHNTDTTYPLKGAKHAAH